MARTNRVVLKDAVYHITSRVAHREFLFASAAFKDRIAEWIHGIAAFSGVEVFAWAILDNHFHLVVHVPIVPEEYWADPAVEPDSQAFGMRPAECRIPRWSPVGGDSPQGGGRPEVGFMLSDEEMLERLQSLYDDEQRIERLRRSWQEKRLEGNGAAVDAVKEGYARRMYNLPQFVKTFKERIAMVYNREFKHEGALWQGRFHSAVVEDANEVRAVVAAYDDYNAVKAGIVDHPSQYRWCSFGSATGNGRFAEISRRGYEKMFGCTWEEARVRMEALFTFKDLLFGMPKVIGGIATANDNKVAVGNNITVGNATGIGNDADEGNEISDDKKLNVALAIHQCVPAFTCGVYIGHDFARAAEVASALPRNYPCSSLTAAVKRCRQFSWNLVA